MKRLTRARFLILALVASLATLTINAQDKPSPAATATGTVHGATITINYSSPGVKGRKIWGGLVPYGKPWRAGANEATTLTTDKEIKIGGKTLAPGKYTVFATPNETSWTFIFNSEVGQWGIKRTGEANFDAAKNVATVEAKPMKSAAFSERMVYEITRKGFVLRWENLEVPVEIK